MKIGLISGHALPGMLHTKETISVETLYGNISVERSTVGDHDVFFINRHGTIANLPPHKINYLGNISALASCHVDGILAVGTVGSLDKQIHPGEFVVPHDFIDFTKLRRNTFFDTSRVHVDMSTPYCPSLRTLLIAAGKKTSPAKLHDQGVYLATEGPRLETVAEIRLLSPVADIVGMTGVPEVILAREKGVCYASLCLVVNMAAGFQQKLTAKEIALVYKEKEPLLSSILKETMVSFSEKQTCPCCKDVEKATL